MKLFIRYRGLPLLQIELDENKTYRVGRGSDCEVHLSARQIPRKLGEVRCENNQWFFYFNKPNQAPLKLTEQNHVWTNYGLELGLASYLDQESTHVDLPSYSLKTKNWMLATAGSALVAIALGFINGVTNIPNLDSQNLMRFAEDGIVKFELKAKTNQVSQLKKDAGLTDEDFKSSLGFCTGFAVAKNIILTAQHCVVNPPGFEILRDFVIKTTDGREVKPTRILSMDYLQDYLFLEVEGLNNSRSFNFAQNFEIGEKVFTIGNVSGEGLAIRDGIISGETEDINNPLIKHIRFSAAASPGNSGGPLLNSKGEIVALVSRKNMSENYNIGIHFRDLAREKLAVVDRQEFKNAKYISQYSEINLTTLSVLVNRTFGIKFPDFIFARADLADKFKNFSVEIPMPIELNQKNFVLEKKFEEAFKDLAKNLINESNKNNLPGLSWESQATKDFPVVIPAMHDTQTTSFRKINNSLIVPSELGLYGHSGFFGYDDALQKLRKNHVYKYLPGMMALRGSLIEQRIPGSSAKGYLVYSSAKDSNEPIDLSKMFFESPDFSVSYFKSFSVEEKEKIVTQTFKEILFGDQGAIVNLRLFPYIRPKATSEFKLTTFQSDLAKVDSIKDSYGRNWNYYVSSFYESFYVELFCTDSFQSTHCLTSFKEGSYDLNKSAYAKNFVSNELSEKFSFNEYYRTSDINLLNSHLTQNPFLKDFKLFKANNNELVVQLVRENKKLNFGKFSEIQSIRFIPAIKNNPSLNSPSWTGYAAQVVKKSKTGLEICAQGVDPEMYAYHDFINENALQQNLSRRPASYQAAAHFKKNKKQFNVCVPLFSHRNDNKILELDFSNKKDLVIE